MDMSHDIMTDEMLFNMSLDNLAQDFGTTRQYGKFSHINQKKDDYTKYAATSLFQ